MMETYYAPAKRSGLPELKQQLETISKNPVIDGLINFASGLLAVLNSDRQILTLNETFLELLGIGDARKVFGLRPGEAVNCIHSHEQPGGCGTSEYCPTCGAAISILTSLETNKPAERKCAVTIEKNQRQEDLYFVAKSCPIIFQNSRFILLFLQDITKQQQWATLERIFFHDISNIASGIVGRSELLPMVKKEEQQQQVSQEIYKLSLRLSKEITIQRCLTTSDKPLYQSLLDYITIKELFEEIRTMSSNHPAAKSKILSFPREIPDESLKTDISLLLRVLNNMLLNAFEATQNGGEVKLWVEKDPVQLTFCVWNQAAIPEAVSKRIFQRNFSTKAEIGRGLGTYSIKLFGEQFLGGQVDFTTSQKEGTLFRLRLSV